MTSDSAAARASSAARAGRGHGADQMRAPSPKTSGARVACPLGKEYQPAPRMSRGMMRGRARRHRELGQPVERPPAERGQGVAGSLRASPDARQAEAQEQRERDLHRARPGEARHPHDRGGPRRPRAPHGQHQPHVQRLGPARAARRPPAPRTGRKQRRAPAAADGGPRGGAARPASRGARDRSPRQGSRWTPGGRTCAARRACSAGRAASRRRAGGPAPPRRRSAASRRSSASMVMGSPSSTSAMGPPTAASGATCPTTRP